MKEIDDYLDYARQAIPAFDPENIEAAARFYRALDKRLTALEETVEVETKDSYNHYADSFGEVEQRLAAIENDFQTLKGKVRSERDKRHLQLMDVNTRLAAHVYGDVHNEKHTCATCIHALDLDKYDDILCLRASVWQHPRFESSDSMDCDHHYERETQ